MRLEFEVIRY